MERIDIVNENIKLIQRTEGLNFGTDALLLAAYIDPARKYKRGMEYGSGTGIVSLFALHRDKIAEITALEVQEEYASITERNAALNGLADRLHAVHTDLRDYCCAPDECVDIVFSNPPYMKCDTGRANAVEEKNAARHEQNGTIYSFLEGAKKHLRCGGAFVAVYRTDRLIDLIDAMRKNKIEPKRMTYVHADSSSMPSMVLVEGRSGGGEGLVVTPPLLLYRDMAHTDYSDEMQFILKNGSFPEAFYILNKKRRGDK